MSAMDSRQPSLLDPPAPASRSRSTPRLLARPGRAAVEIVRHANGPVEVKVSGLVDTAERRIRQWQGVELVHRGFERVVGGAELAQGVGGSGGWNGILDRYAAVVDGRELPPLED